MVNAVVMVKKTLDGMKDTPSFFNYPDTFNKLPCVSYYEAYNAPGVCADDVEYASDIICVVDIWGKTSVQAADVALQVDELMTAAGFVREFSRDMPDSASKVRHKTMRFKLIC